MNTPNKPKKEKTRTNNAEERFLAYLKERPNIEIKREDIENDLGMSQSTITRQKDKLVKAGYTVQEPTRSGWIKLVLTDENAIIAGDIDDLDVKMWLILLMLSKNGASTSGEILRDILTIMDGIYMSINPKHLTSLEGVDYLEGEYVDIAKDIEKYYKITTLASDLETMVSENLLVKDGNKYMISESAPRMLCLTYSEMDATSIFLANTKDSVSKTPELQALVSKCMDIYPWDVADNTTRLVGRENKIEQSQIEYLQKFYQYPYKTKVLKVIHASKEGQKEMELCTTLLYYSWQTHCFYGLFVNATDQKICQLRLDELVSIEETEEKNQIYRASKYLEIYRKMFAAEYNDEELHVKVLFEDTGSIRRRLVDLYRRRKMNWRSRSKYNVDEIFREICEDGMDLKDNDRAEYPIIYLDDKYMEKGQAEDSKHYIIYEDILIGGDRFARFLSSFGSSAIVLAPNGLRDKMRAINESILKSYGGERS